MAIYEERAGVIYHLEELRKRIIICLVSVLIAAAASFFFAEEILKIIINPVGSLVFISPQEAFLNYIKIAFISGIIVSSPLILFHIWRFISAGLKYGERKLFLVYIPLSFILFAAGVFFAYFLILPIGLKFLLSFGSDALKPMISVGKYVSFTGVLLLVFGAVFELPLLIVFLTRINLITPGFLRSKRRYAIFVIFIVSALLTPPDAVTQILMALPLIMLYEAGIWISVLFKRN